MKLNKLIINESLKRGFQETANDVIDYLKTLSGMDPDHSTLNRLIYNNLSMHREIKGEIHLITDIVVDRIMRQWESLVNSDPVVLGNELHNFIAGLITSGTLFTYQTSDEETKQYLARRLNK